MADKASISSFVNELNKKLGTNNAVQLVGDVKVDKSIEFIPLDIYEFDQAIGGGFPKGRIIEVFGMESCGKTTLTLHALEQAQKAGGTVGFIDVEQALDLEYARKIGVDVDAMVVSQPEYGEQALDVLENMVESGLFDIIIFDSVAAIVPKAELEGDMGEQKMGVVARLMAQAMRKVTPKIKKANVSVVFINQLREKLGVIYGPNEVTTGGNSLKFFASIRIDVRKTKLVEKDGEAAGMGMKIKVVKNKVAPPFRVAESAIMYGTGIDKERSLLEAGIKAGTVEKAGAWLRFDGTNIGNGMSKTCDALRDNPDLYDLIKQKTDDVLGIRRK